MHSCLLHIQADFGLILMLKLHFFFKQQPCSNFFPDNSQIPELEQFILFSHFILVLFFSWSYSITSSILTTLKLTHIFKPYIEMIIKLLLYILDYCNSENPSHWCLELNLLLFALSHISTLFSVLLIPLHVLL